MKALLVLILLVYSVAFATSLRVERRDMKLASQQLLEKWSVTAPDAADADLILNDQATSDSVTTTVSSFLAQPDFCRALVITPGGTTADVPAGDVVVTGTNYFGATITENFTFLANASTATNGTKAFCSVTSIVFPVQDGAAATYDVGTLDKLGLPRCMDAAGHVAWATFGGVYEGTRPTAVANATAVESNTVDLDSALDASSDVEIFYIQNFRCFP